MLKLTDVGRNRRIRTVEVEEAIFEMVQEVPTVSSRVIGRALNISHSTAH